MSPRIEAAGSVCLSIYCSVMESATMGQSLYVRGENHYRNQGSWSVNAYHMSMRLTSALSSAVDTVVVSISIAAGVFSPSSAATGCSTGIALFSVAVCRKVWKERRVARGPCSLASFGAGRGYKKIPLVKLSR